MKSPEILVVGAGGYTARLVLQNLLQGNIPLQVCGRNELQLRELGESLDAAFPIRVHDIQDPDQFAELICGIDVVINCAGPYAIFSADFIRAIAGWSGIYLDLTGELDFVLNSLQELDEKCRANDCLLLHACAFESMVSGLLLSRIADHDSCYEDISSYYSHHNARMSPGTRLTARLTSTPAAQIYRDDRFRQVSKSELIAKPDFITAGDDRLAYYSPLPEVAFFPETYHTHNAGSYLLLPSSEANFLAGLASPNAANTDKLIRKHNRRKTSGPDLYERQQHRFSVIVATRDTNGKRLRISAEGVDPYGLSAQLIVSALDYCIAGAGKVCGVKSPTEVVAQGALLAALESDNWLKVSECLEY